MTVDSCSNGCSDHGSFCTSPAMYPSNNTFTSCAHTGTPHMARLSLRGRLEERKKERKKERKEERKEERKKERKKEG